MTAGKDRTPKPDGLFVRAREPEASVVEALAAIAPPGTGEPWLLPYWFAGEEYDPVQRWVLYEMVPDLSLVAPSLLREFTHQPHPRSRGRWEPDDTVPGMKRWVSESLVSRDQWDLFHRYHCWPQRTWIVQGANGGHQSNLTKTQFDLFRLVTGDLDAVWPLPGALPYAPIDERVYERLRERKRLGDWERRMEALGTDRAPGFAGLVLQGQNATDRERLDEAIARFLEEQMYGIKDALSQRLVAHILEDAPYGPGVSDEQIARLTHA